MAFFCLTSLPFTSEKCLRGRGTLGLPRLRVLTTFMRFYLRSFPYSTSETYSTTSYSTSVTVLREMDHGGSDFRATTKLLFQFKPIIKVDHSLPGCDDAAATAHTVLTRPPTRPDCRQWWCPTIRSHFRKLCLWSWQSYDGRLPCVQRPHAKMHNTLLSSHISRKKTTIKRVIKENKNKHHRRWQNDSCTADLRLKYSRSIL